MRYTVILVCVCVFIVWLIGIQIFIRILEDYETRKMSSKHGFTVRITDYDSKHKPPLISAVAESGDIIYLKDYDKKFEFSAQVYYNKWVYVTLVNHYYGLLLIRVESKVCSVIPTYVNDQPNLM